MEVWSNDSFQAIRFPQICVQNTLKTCLLKDMKKVQTKVGVQGSGSEILETGRISAHVLFVAPWC